MHLALLRDHRNIGKVLVVAPQHRVVYTVVPKAANSTIKRYLWAACGDVLSAKDVMRAVHRTSGGAIRRATDFPSRELRAILQSNDWFRFSFVRNPYARLISAYKDKILGERPKGDELRFIRKIDPKATGPIPFRDFITTICGHDDGRMDHHWRPQTALLMDEAIRYNQIGRVEFFNDDMRAVVARLNLPRELVTRFQTEPINRTKPAVVPDGLFAPRFDADLAEMVHHRFRADFERFGYDPDSWRYPSASGRTVLSSACAGAAST